MNTDPEIRQAVALYDVTQPQGPDRGAIRAFAMPRMFSANETIIGIMATSAE